MEKISLLVVEDEKIVANSGRVVARLMDGTVYAGVLFVTSYRLAFVSKELPGAVVELPVASGPRH